MNVSRNVLRRLAATRTAAVATTTRSSGPTASSSFFLRFCGTTPAAGGDVPLSAFGGSSSSNHQAASFSSKASLSEILDREYNEEIDVGNTSVPQDLADLRTAIASNWKISSEDKTVGATASLHSLKDDRVRVSFHCQDTLEVGEDVAGEDDDGEEEERGAPVRFTVTVSGKGKSSSLTFACFSEEGSVRIEGVSTTSSSTVDHVHENQGMLPKVEYQGPDFTELDEDLQEAWYRYLEEDLGIDSDLAAYVAMEADFREELCYVDFLREARSIL